MNCPKCGHPIPMPVPIERWIRKNKFDLSHQRAKKLAQQGRIPGAFKQGRVWYVPEDNPDPRLPEGKPRTLPEPEEQGPPGAGLTEKEYQREYYLRVTRQKRPRKKG